MGVENFIVLFVIIIAITIHEYTHAKLADLAGDPTPRIYGRVTLNPVSHFDPLGFLMIAITVFAGFGLGWGRPVPMDPRKMRNPKWDHFWAVFGAPLSNLLQALIFAIIIKLLALVGVLATLPPAVSFFFLAGVMVNVGLFVFNLLPLGPLDGMWVVGTFMPERTRVQWTRFNLTYGQFIFIGLILFGQGILASILSPVREFFFRLLL